MINPTEGSCSNRDVVNADKRLYSPRYDDEKKKGRAWYELSDADAMCFWGICGHASYNAWVKSTNRYINEVLVPHYKKVLGRAHDLHGDAMLPIPLSDKFNKVVVLVDAWTAAGYRPNKTIADDFLHPIMAYWAGEIRKIIDYFDEAACLLDSLDLIAVEDLKQPSLAKGAPVRQLEHIEGGYLGGAGGPSKSGSKKSNSSTLGMAVGIVAIGAAGYFGFKVLTE